MKVGVGIPRHPKEYNPSGLGLRVLIVRNPEMWICELKSELHKERYVESCIEEQQWLLRRGNTGSLDYNSFGHLKKGHYDWRGLAGLSSHLQLAFDSTAASDATVDGGNLAPP